MARGAPTPFNEAQRLGRVADLCLLDPEPDPVLDQLVSTVSLHFNVPIALVSIVGEHRQWFRAGTGLCQQGTARDISFCAHAILSGDVMQVCDAQLDDRFRENPLVTGAPNIRFYAAAPLTTEDGLGLGSLCIIDTQPRPRLSAHDAQMLRHFAQLAMLRLSGLRHASYLDGPTGLFNRLRLEQDITAVLPAGDHCLAVVDMLSPSFLNDIVKALGYSFSQELVGVMHGALKAHLPAHTTLYKVSPTRFGFLLPPHVRESPEVIFQRLVSAFEAPLLCRNIPIQPQAGVGAIRLQLGDDVEKDWLRLVVSAADEARAKGTGWRWYEPHLDLAQQRAFLLLGSLAEAVRTANQLHLVYQPRIEVATGRVVTVEALLRWQHPVLGPVSPTEFVPLAEKTALIRPLSLWVLREAVQQAARWQRQGHRFKVAINVSAPDLGSPAFIDLLLDLLAQHQVEPKGFEVEFTESALSDNPSMVRAQLERLRAIGMDVAIDDFGSGYSNWAYLRELPATTVKLDRSLVQNAAHDIKDHRLIEAIVDLARRVGYRVVAEGIETEQVYQAMCEMGCQEAQGFLLARPMNTTLLERWLQHERPGVTRYLRALNR
ncbi:GGDEF and EAL domain-containing protein [Pseudomonas typographi]|uniref:GGDEF and EAL domain-containing protein n=1 Tax=Pseudomonas typographi TaxID=2715964 RepID=A0ABR7Z437_9PSED|nr:GGDEF and EAL domain-containing protein [Pseudomonas typographi]MBD1600108.1 GGDEF and EAL domain-containing protein [Pseudomonas typographi]